MIAEIKREVGRHYRVTERELNDPSRGKMDVARSRMVAIYLARTLGEGFGNRYSTTSVGKHFGGREHTTVIHACREVEKRIASDEAECAKVMAVLMDLTIEKLLAEAQMPEVHGEER